VAIFGSEIAWFRDYGTSAGAVPRDCPTKTLSDEDTLRRRHCSTKNEVRRRFCPTETLSGKEKASASVNRIQ